MPVNVASKSLNLSLIIIPKVLMNKFKNEGSS